MSPLSFLDLGKVLTGDVGIDLREGGGEGTWDVGAMRTSFRQGDMTMGKGERAVAVLSEGLAITGSWIERVVTGVLWSIQDHILP